MGSVGGPRVAGSSWGCKRNEQRPFVHREGSCGKRMISEKLVILVRSSCVGSWRAALKSPATLLRVSLVLRGSIAMASMQLGLAHQPADVSNDGLPIPGIVKSFESEQVHSGTPPLFNHMTAPAVLPSLFITSSILAASSRSSDFESAGLFLTCRLSSLSSHGKCASACTHH